MTLSHSYQAPNWERLKGEYMRWYDVSDTSENALRLEWLSLVCEPGFRRTRMFDHATIRRLENGNNRPEFDLQTGLTALRFGSSVL
jgi:hypothetical protein